MKINAIVPNCLENKSLIETNFSHILKMLTTKRRKLQLKKDIFVFYITHCLVTVIFKAKLEIESDRPDAPGA